METDRRSPCFSKWIGLVSTQRKLVMIGRGPPKGHLPGR
jgi:hypothetical protein